MRVMKEIIQEFIQYRELLRTMTLRNIQMKYKQTAMGFLWAIFMPVLIILSGIVVKGAMSMMSGRTLELKEIVSVSVKALPWAFFVGALKFSVGSIVANMGLVTKIYFPRELFPISYVLGQLFDLCIASFFLAVILVFAHIGISIYILWLPLIMLFLILLTMGLALILSCGNVFFRDVRYIIDTLLTFGIFFTPVFYEARMFPKFRTILLLNPVGSILETINTAVVLHQMPDIFWLTYAGLTSIIIFIASLIIFHKNEPLIAENI